MPVKDDGDGPSTTKKERKITIKLSDIDRVCRACGRVRTSTHQREYRAKNYQGSCGDSFCWASCTMSACKPIHAQVCDQCAASGKGLAS